MILYRWLRNVLYVVLLPVRCIRSEHGNAVKIGMYVWRIDANRNNSIPWSSMCTANRWNLYAVFWKNCYSKEVPDSRRRLF